MHTPNEKSARVNIRPVGPLETPWRLGDLTVTERGLDVKFPYDRPLEVPRDSIHRVQATRPIRLEFINHDGQKWEAELLRDDDPLNASILALKNFVDRLCRSCGRQVFDSKACPHCGTQLTGDPVSKWKAYLVGLTLAVAIGIVAAVAIVAVHRLLGVQLDPKLPVLAFAIIVLGILGFARSTAGKPRDFAKRRID